MSQQQQQHKQLHVITENGEQCFMWRSNQLTYIAQDRQELPLVLATKFGSLATKLDLSYNTLTSYKNINLFTNLSELILDNNYLDDNQLFEGFKQNLRLKTLSLNKNKLSNLPKLINLIKIYFPNLEFLSLIGNPLCPSPLSNYVVNNNDDDNNDKNNNKNNKKEDGNEIYLLEGETSKEIFSTPTINQVLEQQGTDFNYQKYRHFIIYHLPNLRFLDSKPISNEERDESLRRCFWMESATTSLVENKNNSNEIFDGQSQHENENESYSSNLTNNNNNNNINITGRQLTTTTSRNTIIDNNNRNRNNFVRADNNNNNNLTIMSDYSNDYDDYEQHRIQSQNQNQIEMNCSTSEIVIQPKGAFTRLSYKYTGKNSEGNRFIRNNDL